MSAFDKEVEMVLTNFGPALAALRRGAGLSQAGLAKASGLHRQLISKYERGVVKPSWEQVVRLAKALGCSADAFMEAQAE